MKNLLKKGVAGALLVLASLPLVATVLEELTLEQLVADSELIFEGEVLSVTVSTEDDLVYSTVLFQVDAVHKGQLSLPELELRFLGGADKTLELEVAGQYVPVTGEHGLYFVADQITDHVNPLTGWGQGYFPIFTGEDGTAYLDLRNHPYYAILDRGDDPLLKKMRDLHVDSETIEQRFPKSREYSLEDFLAAVQSLLEQ